jgi:glycosyltransferase involved in cell wall biosynthesis
VRSVALWHPFTARSIGWKEEQLALSHSRPHLASLRRLSRALGIRCRVEYLTDRRLPRFISREDLEWRYWPRSLRVIPGKDKFRREWSLSGLMATALRPADVTIINTSGHGGAFARALANSLRRHGRPYIAMIGGLNATVDGAQRRYFEAACAVAVHNSTLRDFLIASGIPSQRVVVVPLGVNVELFDKSGPGQEFKARPSLLYVGRLDKHKGVDLLIRAVAAVKRQHLSVTLNIIGPHTDPSYVADLHQLVAALSLQDTVHFLGAMGYDELPPYYRAASLFVLPSRAEGFGMVVVESMACGTPVVALRAAGGPSDIITDGEDGRLVEETDLAREIGALLADPAKLSSMSLAARCTAVERFSEAATARPFDDMLSRAAVTPVVS